MEKNTKMWFFGLLTWLVPFVFSWPFYDEEGNPVIDLILIKTIMIVLFSAFGAFLLIQYYRVVDRDFLNEGIRVGVIWLVLNWALDLVFLVGAFGMDAGVWFWQIGARYVVIPTMSISMGYAIEMKIDREGPIENKMSENSGRKKKGA